MSKSLAAIRGGTVDRECSQSEVGGEPSSPVASRKRYGNAASRFFQQTNGLR
jgi:hypothetical protein